VIPTRKVVVERFGGADQLRLQDGAAPAPGPGQLRIRAAAAGVAAADLLMRAGRYPGGPKPPFTPGWDVAGTVEAVGQGVDGSWLGADVIALVLTGGYADRVVAPLALTARVPEGVTLPLAACLTLNYTTAFQMLTRVVRARPGERILVHGAAGGVGTALLDLARDMGLQAFGAASPGKAGVIAGYGARFLDRTAGDPATQVLALAPGGVDVVLDPLGGPHVGRAFAALRPGGRLVSYGFAALAGRRFVTARVLAQLLALHLRHVAPTGRAAAFYRLSAEARRHPARVQGDMASLLERLAAGRLRPLVAECLPLARAAEAHARLESGAVQGKLLLAP
jgi:NADPH:quinone reductase